MHVDIASKLRATPWQARIAGALLLTAFVLQAGWASRRDSVTIDEFVHLPVGIHALYSGDYSLDPINPPFPRMIAALPMLFVAPAFAPEPGVAHWGMGYHLMYRNADEYHEIFVSARAMITGLGVLLGFFVWHWSTVLYGWRAALIALTFFAFSPTMLAHGHLVTLDMSGALGFTFAAYAIWRMLGTPTFGFAVFAGVAFGVATLLKLSGSVLVVVVIVGTAIRVVSTRDDVQPLGPVRALGLLVTAGLTSLLLLNAAYGFEGTLGLLSQAKLDPSGRLAGLVESYPGIRLPFPRSYVEGVDMVMNVGAAVEPSYFLNGELTSEGWWYYHLAAFFYKTPIPVLISILLALIVWPWTRIRDAREYCVWLPVVLVFLSNTALNSLQIGVRHVLPVYPLLFVFVSGRLEGGMRRCISPALRRTSAVVVGSLLLWLVAGTLAVGPRYLQYFNAWAGGPEGGHERLVDSNIDWGQDLLRLSEYMKENQIDQIQLAYFGRVDPKVYGVNYVALEPPGRPGFAAVSATFLMGRPYFWILHGRMRWVPANTYSWLQAKVPVARAGSMFIYKLD